LVYDGSNFVAIASGIDQGIDFQNWSTRSPTGVTWTDTLYSETDKIDSSYTLLTNGSGEVIIVGVDVDGPAIMVQRSTNSGVSWTEHTGLGSLDDDTIAIYASTYDGTNDRYVFIALDTDDFDRVYVSNSTGTVWTLEHTAAFSIEAQSITFASGPDFYVMGGFALAYIASDFSTIDYYPPV
jgi:hypothetical protein